MLNLLLQDMEEIPEVRVMINIGCLFDIGTGEYVLGQHGEHILNGGLATTTGIVGIGNNFKSTILDYMELKAMGRIRNSAGNQYDTEMNMHKNRKRYMAARIEEFGGIDIIENKRLVITDKVLYTGNEYYEKQKTYLETKIKNRDKLLVEIPMLDKRTGKPMKMMIPTFNAIDSLSDFETDDVIDMQAKNELGESGGNTIQMRQGLAKLRFLQEAPRINGRANNYLLMTAQIGKESTMQNAGPGGQQPITKLKHLKNGDKIKGVTDKFTFLTNNCYHAFNSAPMINDSTKGPEYPRDSNDNLRLDTDLNAVQIRLLRGKSGPSGMANTIIVSQEDGVQPSLTEFQHIKDYGRYGLEGNNINYNLAIYPDCKLSRTTIRGKIDTDFKLRRALNITSEICQMSYLWHKLPEGLLVEPAELYKKIIDQGYDWDMILTKTRGWWTTDNDKHPLLFLSSMDILKMSIGEYHPYWLEADKKTIKKEYIVT